MNKKIIVAVSGYFNPIHIGHLEMLKIAKSLGDYLIVIVNNDKQVELKGRVNFMPEEDRAEIVRAIRYVDEVFISIDEDKTVCKSLEKIKPNIFANGGDRKNINDIPEYEICKKLNIKMIDGCGEKIRSSSILIKNASEKKHKNQ
ncbi:MAG: adenylyltransferase/cytidyltransferase family protein [Candidatus Falkowbacteria bacterium]